MANREITVLSFSRDPVSLAERQRHLQAGGFEVISVSSEAEARLEIEMGRCGILVACASASDLMKLFRRNCPDGRIIFVKSSTSSPASRIADYVLEESQGPEAIVQVLRSSSADKFKKAN